MKILLIRFSSIGDIILASPVVRCLKIQLDAEIHFLCKKQFSEIISSNPHIEKVITLRSNLGDTISELKPEAYDLVIDLHKNLRSSRIITALKVKTISFDKLNFQKWMLVNFKINNLPDLHLVDRYFKALKKINLTNDNGGLDFFIPEKDHVDLNTHFGMRSNEAFTCLSFGAAHYTKSIPETSILKIIDSIPGKIVLIGGKKESELAQAITTQNPRVYNACGKFSINQSASIIRKAKILITADTGMMHIGAAFRKKIIVFWGSTVPGFGMWPYMPGVSHRPKFIQNEDLKCRPCSKIGFEQCPKNHFKCMQHNFTKDLKEHWLTLNPF